MSAPRRIGTEFDAAAFAHQGRTHEVFRAGHGPGVIVVHEIPGLHPGVVEFGRRLIDAGYPSTYRPGEGIAMTHIAGEVTVDAPVDEVFDMVADERNEPRYNPRIVRAEKVSEGPIGTGSRFVAAPKGMGAKGEMAVEIVEYDRPHRLHTVVRSSYMRVDGTLTFDGVEGGTRLRWDWDMVLLGPLRVLSPVLSSFGPGWERRNWVGLKKYMESGRR